MHYCTRETSLKSSSCQPCPGEIPCTPSASQSIQIIRLPCAGHTHMPLWLILLCKQVTALDSEEGFASYHLDCIRHCCACRSPCNSLIRCQSTALLYAHVIVTDAKCHDSWAVSCLQSRPMCLVLLHVSLSLVLLCMQITLLNSEKEVLEESAATANARVQETREAMAAQAKQLGQLQYLPPRLQDMQEQV